MSAYNLRRALALLFFLSLLGHVQAQEERRPIVAFLLNPDIEARSLYDPGADGVRALAGIFQDLGAEVQVVNLIEEVSPSTDVLVIAGPQAPLDIVAIVRLWLNLSRGNNLLLALDPVGYAGATTEDSNSNLLGLLTNAYGVIASDAFLAEPWFTRQSISFLGGSYLRSYGDIVPHPVIEPLVQYGLPVQLWGARTLRIEPIGVDSVAVPLLYTDTAYAETNEDVFDLRGVTAPLELNLETDAVGRLNVAGLGENSAFGSRIAVVGDSELFQNGYGLALAANSSLPLHPGNRLFAERLAAWLLELPIEDWPPLPAGFTWIAIDGDDADWTQGASTSGETDTAIAAQYDIEGVRALRNDSYLYLMVETRAAPSPQARVDFELGRAIPRQAAVATMSGSVEQVSVVGSGDERTALPDAAMGVGSVIELRVPLRVVGSEEEIGNLCLFDDSTSQAERDCIDGSVAIRQVNQREPFDTRVPEGPLVTVGGARNIVLRQGPGTEFSQVALLAPGRVLAAQGRNVVGDWIQVQTARHTGWAAASLLLSNHDLLSLPVVEAF